MNVCAAGDAELRVDGDGEHRLRTGRSQAGLGRPVPSGTLGESTGMLHTASQSRLECSGRGLTSAELVDDIGRPESAKISTTESSQQSDTGPQTLNRGSDEGSEVRIPAI